MRQYPGSEFIKKVEPCKVLPKGEEENPFTKYRVGIHKEGRTQRYLTLIDGGLVYTALSSPWGRFSDYSATGS
jgi:hypothetical protein